MKKTDAPVIVEQTFDTSIGNVWSAITNHPEMIRWFFENIPAFEPVTGFQTSFDVISDDRVFPHIWQITEVIPLKKITYDWSYDGYSGRSVVEFELTDEEDRTRLTLTATVTEDFDDNIPEFRRDSCEAGWDYFIKGRLRGYLEIEEYP